MRGNACAHRWCLYTPQAPIVEVPEARHHVMLDQPLAFVAAVRMLLENWIWNE